MIKFCLFLLGEPPSSDIASENWDTFVGDSAWFILPVMLIGVILSLLWYKHSAHRTMIHSPTDLFLPYKPLRNPTFVALGAAIIAAVIELIWFHSLFETSEGMFQTAGRTAVWVAGVVGIISYMMILVYKPLTPSKFKYRPHLWPRSARKPT